MLHCSGHHVVAVFWVVDRGERCVEEERVTKGYVAFGDVVQTCLAVHRGPSFADSSRSENARRDAVILCGNAHGEYAFVVGVGGL